MIFNPTAINGVFFIKLNPFKDERGYFTRLFCSKVFGDQGLTQSFVQTNHSCTQEKGTVRGLHCQKPPFMEAKLIRCVRGAVFDVAVDLRHGSPTFLEYVGIELSEDNHQMIYIAEGIAHGFQTLFSESSMIYHHSEYYTPEAEMGIRYDEPRVNIEWPLPVTHTSEKDKNLNFLPGGYQGIVIPS